MEDVDYVSFYEEKIRELVSNVSSLRDRIENYGDIDAAVINPVIYLSLACIDILIGMKYFVISNDRGNGEERNYFARTVALNVYELLNDIDRIVNRNKMYYVPQDIFDKSLKPLRAQVHEAVQPHKASFKDIRHNIVGHKDDDGMKQIKMMIEMDLEGLFSCVHETMFKINNLLGATFIIVWEYGLHS